MKITLHNLQDVFASKLSSIESMELKGYTLLREYFVDSSGFGAEDELALQPHKFIEALEQEVKQHGTVYTTITNAGQFQVYVGVFLKTGKSRARKIANNTLRIETDHGYIIRLHDTNIITVENGTITLDMGGWDTMTTRARLNAYLPARYQVIRRGGESFLIDSVLNIKQPFIDGMKVEA